MATDTASPPDRPEIERLLGECLLGLQTAELRMKAILGSHRISGSAETLEQLLAQRIVEPRRKTMGALVGDLTESFLVPEGRQGSRDESEDQCAISSVMRIELPTEEFSRVEAELRELTSKRNRLAHHFLEDHDIQSTEGRRAAGRDISAAIDRVASINEYLKESEESMDQMRKAFAERLASPDFCNWIVGGEIPWHVTSVVHALHDAATALSQDGWTSVEAAKTWIATRSPDERPEHYGCRTWRQLIHESRLFDLRTRPADGRRQAWYRPRTSRGRPAEAQDD